MPPDLLDLEITEDISLGHERDMLAVLAALKARGVGLALDDFGTGYASLGYLTRFPLTTLKIDCSFVARIAREPSAEDSAIVRSIITMAQSSRWRRTSAWKWWPRGPLSRRIS